MHKLRCIIIEDEPLALLRTQQYVEKVPFLDLTHAFSDPLKALPVLLGDNIDLLFLDIQMEQLTGIQLLKTLPHPPLVIFTTAHEEFALKAFDLDAVDYLLKPFSFERFLQAVMKVRQRRNGEILPMHLFFKTGNRQQRINLDDITHIEGAGDYRKLYFSGQSLLTLETFGELEERLPQALFQRVHKSHMVSIARVEAVESTRLLLQDKWIPLSDRYREKLLAMLGAIRSV